VRRGPRRVLPHHARFSRDAFPSRVAWFYFWAPSSGPFPSRIFRWCFLVRFFCLFFWPRFLRFSDFPEHFFIDSPLLSSFVVSGVPPVPSPPPPKMLPHVVPPHPTGFPPPHDNSRFLYSGSPPLPGPQYWCLRADGTVEVFQCFFFCQAVASPFYLQNSPFLSRDGIQSCVGPCSFSSPFPPEASSPRPIF